MQTISNPVGFPGWVSRCAVALLAGVLTAPAMVADASTLVFSEARITVSSMFETSPTLGNDGTSDLVVYTAHSLMPNGELAPGDIWYQRLTPGGAPTGPAVQVTSGAEDDQLNDVSGDYIVYVAYDSVDSSSGAFMLYRISTRETTQVARVAVISAWPRIHGRNIVWVEGAPGATTVKWQTVDRLAAGEPARDVAGPWPPVEQVAVGSDYIVWTQAGSVESDIWAFDLAINLRFWITSTDEFHESKPATGGPWVTWEARRQGVSGSSIEAFHFETGDSRQVVSGGAWNLRPSIDGDLIVWESTVNGNFDIFLYRLSDGETFQVTTDPADQYLNDVFGNKVAYVDYDRGGNGNQDIYVATFTRPPVADAGADQTVHAGSLVTLDGTASSDPDLDYPLTYEWGFMQKPPGSAATLAGSDTATPSFTADVMGDYVIRLLVRDAMGWPSSDTVTVSTANTAPVAAAGPDQGVVLTGSTVQLDGSTSYDPDGDAITFLWAFVSRPLGSAAALSDPAAAAPTFVADVFGPYQLSLTVRDPFGGVSSDEVIVSFENVRPVANAGTNQAVTAPSAVTLDGSASTDANGDPLTYLWNLVSWPAGSTAVLDGETTAHPGFVADLGGQYVLSLTVSDGLLTSEPSSVIVTATAGSEAVIGVLRETVGVINGLPAASFKNPNMANALTNKIAAMIQLVEQGRYAEALDKASNDLLPKTNGCAAGGVPDNNDWIKDCAAQAQVYPMLLQTIALLSSMP